MATKKTSTKAKTKTTKTAAKTGKKTAAATAKKSPTKALKAANVNKRSIKEINLPRLRSLHMMSAGIFVLLAVAAGLLMSTQSYQMSVSYLTQDELTGTLAPAMRSIYDLEIRWLLVATLLLSVVLPVLYLTKLQKRYETQLQNNRFVPWRWLDFGITGALIVGILALLNGVQDFMALKLVGGVVFVSFLLGWIAERQNNSAKKPVWAPYGIAVLAGIMPWALIAVSAVSTVVYGSVWAPWYVYAALASGLAGFAALYYIQFTDIRKKRTAWQNNYLIVERNYLAVNALTKTALAIILIVGLLQ